MNNSQGDAEQTLILNTTMYPWGYERLTITNGGFELAASATKYCDDSHQVYHLHK